MLILSPKRHFFFYFFVEGRAEDSDDYQRYAEVDDVSAVAARVAAAELKHGGEDILVALAGDDAASAEELGDDGEDYQRGEDGGHRRVEVGRIFPGLNAEENHHQRRRRPSRSRGRENCASGFR